MKVKDPVESCGGMTKEHEYIGHFAQSKHLNRGHNSEPVSSVKSPLDSDKFTVTKTFPFDPNPEQAAAKAKKIREPYLGRG